MIRIIKKLIPDSVKAPYHFTRGLSAALLYGFPAKKMIIIGVTGTKGKTSTGNYIWSVLQKGGYATGLISSAIFRIGEKEEINAYHMTMPSTFIIQKKLHEMYQAGIQAVVVEMTSEGMKQYRHIGIPVDIAIFTNLTPEHLSSHKGSFEVYKLAKAPLFKALNHPPKVIAGQTIARTIIANTDNEHAQFYLSFPADIKITYGLHSGALRAEHIEPDKEGTSFTVDGDPFRLSIPGTFNIYNALPAIATADVLGITRNISAEGVASLTLIPGRMEIINEGQNFTVVVDYAHEPASLEALLRAAMGMKAPEGKIILLTGGQGGGRDPRKREPMAKLAGTLADYILVTNEDPYEDDPEAIVKEIAGTVAKNLKSQAELFILLDRKEAIRKALELAREGDIVLIAGKGAETSMMIHGGAIPWDERAIVRNTLKEILSKK